MYRTMRRRCRFLLLVALVLILLTYKFQPLIKLLSEDGSLDSISASLLLNDPYAYRNPKLIPKIIHQTYKNTSIPLKWQLTRNMTLKYHEDYEYMFWTDESALDFISTNYPTYLNTYVSYPYPIQRADAIRYFVLYHFGGIYLDLDITPSRRLDSLLTLPAFACLTTPTGISNDALGSAPRHPFFLHAINSLQRYGRSSLHISPYITIMSSTGPLFLSLVWKEWLDNGKSVGSGRLRVLVPEGRGYGFFINVEGRSWQGTDERIIAWLERHWLFDMVLGIVAVFMFVQVGLRLFDWAWKRVYRRCLGCGRLGLEWWRMGGDGVKAYNV